MKVALLSHFTRPVVEPFAGGLEAFLFRFAIALRRQGVEVVCYACEDSTIPGVEIRTCGVSKGMIVYPRVRREMRGDEVLAIRALEDAVLFRAVDDIRRDPSIDVLHNHSFSAIPFFLSSIINTPMLHTLHDPPVVRPNIIEALRFHKNCGYSLNIVGLSQTHVQLWNAYYPINYLIHPGLDIEMLPSISDVHDGSLAFVGRIVPDKGVEDAIHVAAMLGKPLDIYGAPHLSSTSYFETRVQPLLEKHANVTYHGLVSQSELFHGLRRAQALLFPVKWEEPCGLAIIEAMSVGTPVIMYDRGSARDLIKEEINGFVVAPDSLQAMAEAVKKTERINRTLCGIHTRMDFDIDNCARSYLNIFRSICQK